MHLIFVSKVCYTKTYVISFPASQPPSFEMSATLGSAVRIMGGTFDEQTLVFLGTACAYTDWYQYIYISTYTI